MAYFSLALLTRKKIADYLPALCMLAGCFLLCGCGFQLRGLDKSVLAGNYVTLSVENEAQHRELIKKTTINMLMLGAHVESGYNRLNKASRPDDRLKEQNLTQVHVDNIRLKKIKLAGTLAEVKLELSATVKIQRAQQKPLLRTLHVLRTYQYDAATVNTRNQQEGIIIQRMNTELAKRIARQLSLYHVRQ